MPFKSEKQRRYLWANEPEIARKWTDNYNEGGGVRKRTPLYKQVSDVWSEGWKSAGDNPGGQYANQAGQQFYKNLDFWGDTAGAVAGWAGDKLGKDWGWETTRFDDEIASFEEPLKEHQRSGYRKLRAEGYGPKEAYETVVKHKERGDFGWGLVADPSNLVGVGAAKGLKGLLTRTRGKNKGGPIYANKGKLITQGADAFRDYFFKPADAWNYKGLTEKEWYEQEAKRYPFKKLNEYVNKNALTDVESDYVFKNGVEEFEKARDAGLTFLGKELPVIEKAVEDILPRFANYSKEDALINALAQYVGKSSVRFENAKHYLIAKLEMMNSDMNPRKAIARLYQEAHSAADDADYLNKFNKGGRLPKRRTPKCF